MPRFALLAAGPLVAALLGWHLGPPDPPRPPRAAAAVSPGPPVWVAPLPGPLRVTRGFSPPATAYGTGHRGVDLAGRPGEDVRAAGAGVVSFAGTVAGAGVVTITHPNGLRTTYEPVTPSVAMGRRVGRGDVVATLRPGHPGCPAPACLHWGLIRGAGREQAYLDPLLLLGLVRPRLLPLAGRPVSSPGGRGPPSTAPAA